MSDPLWPDVRTEDGIRYAITLAAIASYVTAGLTAVFVVMRFLTTLNLLDAAVMIAAGLGMQLYKSRVAAFTAFGFSVLGSLAAFLQEVYYGVFGYLVLILIWWLFNGIRGTMAFQKRRRGGDAKN